MKKKNRELWIKIVSDGNDAIVRASDIESIEIYCENKHRVNIHLKSERIYTLDSVYTYKEAEECRTELLRLMAYPKKFMIVGVK